MSYYRIGDTGIFITATGVRRVNFAAAPPPPPPGGLTVVSTAQYVDTSGNLQTVTANSSTTPTITGVAPLSVRFNSGGSRSIATTGDTEGEAFTQMAHRFDSGEGLAGTWSLTGGNKNVIEGAPIVGHVFTSTGTHTVTQWVRDSEGRQSLVTFSAVISAPGAGTDVAVGGSWPTITNGMIINLAAGTDHSGKGTLNLSGLHNVLIRKTGSGADPIVSAINWDNRNTVGTVASRTRGCRTLNIAVGSVNESAIGSLYCSVVGGNLGSYSMTPATWFWENEASTQNEKDNIRFPRGMSLWDCGVVSSNGTSYVVIGEASNFTARNVDFNKTTGDAGQHVLRGWFRGLDLRHCRFRANAGVAFTSYCKLQGSDNGSTLDPWPEDDKIGVWNGSKYFPTAGEYVVSNNVFGAAGSNNSPGNNIEMLPENDSGLDQAIELCSLENNVWYVTSWSGWSNAFAGRHMQYANNRMNLGAGGEAQYQSGATTGRLDRVPPGWDGPYINAARPVVVP